MMERLSIFLIQFINFHSCLNDLRILNCLIIHYKIHKLIKIRKYFDDIWIECPILHCGLFIFCLILFFFIHHNFLKHFLIQILLCILLFFVLIFTRQSFFKITRSHTFYIVSNLLVFFYIIF